MFPGHLNILAVSEYIQIKRGVRISYIPPLEFVCAEILYYIFLYMFTEMVIEQNKFNLNIVEVPSDLINPCHIISQWK